ncbi:hypothetical protein Tco_1473634 [Tanacetum coccineum]
MDGQGVGSCMMLGSASSVPSFLFAPQYGWQMLIAMELGKVALPPKWKRCSWVVTGRPIDRLGIGRTLQFDSTPLLQ